MAEKENKPIRVLQIVTYMGRGGLETMLMNYYRLIDRTKVQFDFLVHRDFEADYDREIADLGGRIYRVPRLVPWSGKYKRALNEFFRSHPEYRIVHVHQDCLSAVALKQAKECGVPVRIAHAHTSNTDLNWKRIFKKHYMKQIPKYATCLFACGDDAGKWMFGGAPFVLLRNAINTNKYTFSADIAENTRKGLGIPKDAFVIGHVGRFITVKNHLFLVRLFAEIRKTNKNAILLLVGDGEMRSIVESRISSLGLTDSVVLTGLRSDVCSLMCAMDVFVFPSLYEGIPLSLIEAQASSLPCVISDRISEGCEVTGGLVTRLPLSAPIGDWASAVTAERIPRKNRYDEISRAGYDIFESERNLQKFYLECENAQKADNASEP